MEDAPLVRERDRREYLVDDLERVAKRQRAPPGEPRGEGLAGQQLEHEERQVAVHAHVVQRDDVRVEQLRRRARLALEQPDRVVARFHRRAQRLHRHLATEPEITRAEHHAHPAAADPLDQLVRAVEHLPGREPWLRIHARDRADEVVERGGRVGHEREG